MKQSSISFRFGRNEENIAQTIDNGQDLLTGLISSIKIGFLVDTLKTGFSNAELHQLLAKAPQLKQEIAVIEMLSLLRDEGERTPYSILLPYLLSSNSGKEAEKILRERFFGIELFIQRAHNLFRFLDHVHEKNIVFIEKKDLECGILAWDMGELISLSRIACETGYIDEETACEYIRFAGEQCRRTFSSWEEVGKSYLIGQAMIIDNREEADQMIQCFLLATESEESPWNKNHLSRSTT